MNYVRSLDGLRALAILLVMGVHYHEALPFGWVGVQLFFVLSGFLITRILLAAKDEAGFAEYLRVFYVRRALRIFPLYFAFVLLLEGVYREWGIPESFAAARPWLWSYTLNFGHMLERVPIDDMYTHFWSLAVEEQFYLFWPFVVWGLSRKMLGRLLLGIVAGAPVLRWLLVREGLTGFHLYFLTPCQLDALAVGAAVAVFDPPRWAHAKKALWVLLAFSVACGVAANWARDPQVALKALGYPYFMYLHRQYVWGYSLIDLCAALALLACLNGQMRWLEASWLVQIGRLSYGLYVFHRPVIGLLDRSLPALSHRLPGGHALRLMMPLFYVAFSYGLALLSFHVLEARFLALKERFAAAGARWSNAYLPPDGDARPLGSCACPTAPS